MDLKSIFFSELLLSFASVLSTAHQGHLFFLMENQSPVLCVE